MHVTSAFENTFSETLSGLSDVASGVSLTVLRQIDETAEHLAEIERMNNGLAKVVHGIATQIRRLTGEPALSDVGLHIDMAENFARRFAELVVARISGKDELADTSVLAGHHVEFLDACSDAAAVSTARLSEAFFELQASLIDYELRTDPRDGKTFSDVDGFMASLGAA